MTTNTTTEPTNKSSQISSRIASAISRPTKASLEKLRVSELREELKRRNLSHFGKKAELVLRLHEAILKERPVPLHPPLLGYLPPSANRQTVHMPMHYGTPAFQLYPPHVHPNHGVHMPAYAIPAVPLRPRSPQPLPVGKELPSSREEVAHQEPQNNAEKIKNDVTDTSHLIVQPNLEPHLKSKPNVLETSIQELKNALRDREQEASKSPFVSPDMNMNGLSTTLGKNEKTVEREEPVESNSPKRKVSEVEAESDWTPSKRSHSEFVSQYSNGSLGPERK